MSELPDTPDNTSAPKTSEQPRERSSTASPAHSDLERGASTGQDALPGQDKPQAKADKEPDDRRTLGNHPVDPNAWTSKINIPPGIKPEDAVDPGNATPGAAPVDNRSGETDRKD